MVTDVPPAVDPTRGADRRDNRRSDVGVVVGARSSPSRRRRWSTVTLTVPADSAGATAVIEVAEFTVTLVAATLPKLTVSPDAYEVPVIVTDVPPAVGPAVGLTGVTVGAS